jgi:hypothetical protein
LTPEDKVRIHEEIFQLVYYGNGFSHDEVYTMPIFLRYFYLKLLIDQKRKENEANEGETGDVVQKSPARPPIPKKPF